MADSDRKKRPFKEVLTRGIEEIVDAIGDAAGEKLDKFAEKFDEFDFSFGLSPCGKDLGDHKTCGRKKSHKGKCSVLTEEQWKEVELEAERLASSRCADKKSSPNHEFVERAKRVAARDGFDLEKELGDETMRRFYDNFCYVGTNGRVGSLKLQGRFTYRALRAIVKAMEEER